MSYVEEFCRDIAIIDKGNIALAGNLKDIKRQYGENQLVISDVNMGLDELSQIIKDNVSDIITETGRTREEIIVRNINGVSRADILKRMIACGIEIEHFETYKPSLNDIFVSLVGDDMEDDKVVDYKNNSNDDNSYNRDIVDELPQGESNEHKKTVEGGVR
jgi:ABC-2 type transport system ATP-binding protein